MVFTDGGQIVGNLERMLGSEDSRDQWDGRLMARAYRNPAFWVRGLEAEGKHPRVAVDFSGILLENLNKMSGQSSQRDVDGNVIGDVIELWRKVLHEFPDSVEFSGTAYAHCYFPVTPEEDWESQVSLWKKVCCSLFGSESAERVKGFWLPEMGVPAADKLGRLVRLLRNNGYEWLILPVEAVKAEKPLPFEKQVEIFCHPHILRTDGGEMSVIFRPRYDFIDQQAGCDANGIYNKCIEVARISERAGRKPPVLVVPASDGENGNVMMNQFFPDTFIPFFREKADEKVSSITVTQYLKEYPPDDEIELQVLGGSWLGGHLHWEKGDRRVEMKRRIEQLSRRFRDGQTGESRSEEALRALLIAETSCYVYWNSSFWFDQGEKAVEFARRRIEDGA
jgi:alpha-amylase/alpha-mannosidase (GH57 family)